MYDNMEDLIKDVTVVTCATRLNEIAPRVGDFLMAAYEVSKMKNRPKEEETIVEEPIKYRVLTEYPSFPKQEKELIQVIVFLKEPQYNLPACYQN